MQFTSKGEKPLYSIAVPELEALFGVAVDQGISEEERQRRLASFGTNTIEHHARTTFFRLIINQLKNPFLYLLILAAFFKVLASSYSDAFIIGFVIVLNSAIGILQEYRAQKMLKSLQSMIRKTCVVWCNGVKKVISNQQLVPGDIVYIDAGSAVPADMRIIHANKLKINEAALTGESIAVFKHEEIITSSSSQDSLPLTEQKNMLFMGSYVIHGNCVAIVTATGMRTHLGKITYSVENVPIQVPLEQDLESLAHLFLLVSSIVSLIILAVSFHRGYSLLTMISTLTSLFVSIVPENLPIIFTIILSNSVRKMSKYHVLIKRLGAVENLGRAEILLVDKTGTLTRNEQMVTKFFLPDGNAYMVTGKGCELVGDVFLNATKIVARPENKYLWLLARAGVLLDTTELDYTANARRPVLKGEPIEKAFGVLSSKLGVSPEIKNEYIKTFEQPFESSNKIREVHFKKRNEDNVFKLYIGAPESIFNFFQLKDKRFFIKLNEMLAEGLRVVALAQDDAVVALVGMQDTLKEGIESTIKEAQAAGLKIVMATGDHLKTALYIGKKSSLYKEGDVILEEKDLKSLDDATLLKKVDSSTLIARVSPYEKTTIISIYHRLRKIVAMVGDGVNDAPALAMADVGIAMGSMGTEVAKEAADIILVDDSLENIISCIKQGRHILLVVRHIIIFLLVENISEVSLILYSVLFALPLPFLAIHILWQHLLTDSVLGIGLSMEPADEKMIPYSYIPRRLLDTSIIQRAGGMILVIFTGTVILFNYYYKTDLALSRTMVVTTFAFFQWFNALNLRSENRSLLNAQLFFKNTWLISLILISLSVHILVVSLPAFNSIFGFVALSEYEWFICIAVAFQIIVLEEIRKYFRR